MAKFLILLILIFFATQINSIDDDESLSRFTCKIVIDLHEKNNWMKTITLIKGESQLDSSFIDEFLQCLPMEISVVINDGIEKVMAKNAHKYSAVVMLADTVDMVKLIFSSNFN